MNSGEPIIEIYPNNCRWCGEAPEVYEEEYIGSDYMKWEVVCVDEECNKVRMIIAYGNTKEEAINNWNSSKEE